MNIHKMTKNACINYWMHMYMTKQANAAAIPNTTPVTNVNPYFQEAFPNAAVGAAGTTANMMGAGGPSFGPRPTGVFPTLGWFGKGMWRTVKANPIMGIFGATSLIGWPSAIANSYNAMAHPALNTGNYWQQED